MSNLTPECTHNPHSLPWLMTQSLLGGCPARWWCHSWPPSDSGSGGQTWGWTDRRGPRSGAAGSGGSWGRWSGCSAGGCTPWGWPRAASRHWPLCWWTRPNCGLTHRPPGLSFSLCFRKKKFKWRLPFSKNSYIMSMGIWRELYKRKTGLYTGKLFDCSLSYWLMEHTNAYIVNEKWKKNV